MPFTNDRNLEEAEWGSLMLCVAVVATPPQVVVEAATPILFLPSAFMIFRISEMGDTLFVALPAA